MVAWRPHTKFQCDWFLSVKATNVSVAMVKLHTLSHPHVVNNAPRVLGDHMPNFSLSGPLISFWQLKQLPMGVAMTKTHPHVVNIPHLVTWRTHTKVQPDLLVLQLAFDSLNNFCGYGYDIPHPHVINNYCSPVYLETIC